MYLLLRAIGMKDIPKLSSSKPNDKFGTKCAIFFVNSDANGQQHTNQQKLNRANAQLDQVMLHDKSSRSNEAVPYADQVKLRPWAYID